jgi:hypothetical protein
MLSSCALEALARDGVWRLALLVGAWVGRVATGRGRCEADCVGGSSPSPRGYGVGSWRAKGVAPSPALPYDEVAGELIRVWWPGDMSGRGDRARGLAAQ